jgi:DNA-binding response OmpR family regulator
MAADDYLVATAAKPDGRGAPRHHTFITPRLLAGKRVLIVEDEYAVALMIEDFLIEFGCTPVGPCGTVERALNAVAAETFDVALLDVNLDGEMVYPVANALVERHIPFLFLSGYGEAAILPGHADWKVCVKPFTGNDLAAMLTAAFEKVALQG